MTPQHDDPTKKDIKYSAEPPALTSGTHMMGPTGTRSWSLIRIWCDDVDLGIWKAQYEQACLLVPNGLYLILFLDLNARCRFKLVVKSLFIAFLAFYIELLHMFVLWFCLQIKHFTFVILGRAQCKLREQLLIIIINLDEYRKASLWIFEINFFDQQTYNKDFTIYN